MYPTRHDPARNPRGSDARPEQSFHVSLALLLLDAARRRRLRWEALQLAEPVEIAGHRDRLRFLPQDLACPEDLELVMGTLRAGGEAKRLVVVGDCLIGPDGGPTASVQRLRESLASAHHLLCGLVAIVAGPARRVRDIDICVPDDTPDGVRAAVCSVAVALRLKAPPRRGLAATGVAVRPAASDDELRTLLLLRRHVYALLHYLPHDVAADRSGLELDAYDGGALHLVAVDGATVLGGARLIPTIGPHPHPDACRTLLGWRDRHRDGVRRVLPLVGRAMRSRIERPTFLGLPMLQATDFARGWREVLARISPASELSRVIVDPAHRGRGISRLVVREAITAARRLRQRALVLECIPSHESMYARYGFRRFDSRLHSRDADLDQRAVAMYLPLG